MPASLGLGGTAPLFTFIWRPIPHHHHRGDDDDDHHHHRDEDDDEDQYPHCGDGDDDDVLSIQEQGVGVLCLTNCM